MKQHSQIQSRTKSCPVLSLEVQAHTNLRRKEEQSFTCILTRSSFIYIYSSPTLHSKTTGKNTWDLTFFMAIKTDRVLPEVAQL